MPTTTSVSITLDLNSSGSAPPYKMISCNGTVQFSDGTTQGFNSWNEENLGTPQPQGASFTLMVNDEGSNSSQIANWALIFLPRAPTTQASPFGNNINTITGNGGTSNGQGLFTLNIGNSKIKNAGYWDWALMVQMQNGNTIKCFASDPEMEVGT